MYRHRGPSRGWTVCLPFLSLLLPGVVWGGTPARPPEAVTGVAVTAEVPHARESFHDLRQRTPVRLPQGREHRVIPFRRIPRPGASTASEPAVSPSPIQENASALPAPARRSSTVAIDFAGLENLPLTGFRDVVPPDTMGAAGPSHLVSILNSEFGVFSKAGTLFPQSKVTLQAFWASLGTDPGEPADFPFDPKVLYDRHSGRFVAVTLDCTTAPHSWVLLAVSETSDPLGVWNKWAIDADRDQIGDNVFQTNNSADYPGIGVDASYVYVTANMFDAFDRGQHGKVWVIPKAQLLTGSNPITWFEFVDPPSSGFSMQPAHTFGTAPGEYLLFEGGGASLRLARIDNVAGAPVWRIPVSIPVTPYTPSPDLTGAPQLGDPGRIDTADTRMLNAVYRNGSVWGTHHVGGAGGKTEVAWYRIDPSTNTTTAQGRISDPARWYYYPSIAVNQDNVAAVGFSGSSTAEYAGAYYTIVWPSTGADPVSILKAGLAPYNKDLGRGRIRWGDFSATSVDPVDDTSFWTLQEYAMPQVLHNSTLVSMWGTWWGRIVPGEPTPPPPPPPPSEGGGGGCAAVGGSTRGAVAGASLETFLLLLPAAALRWYRRRVRSRKAA